VTSKPKRKSPVQPFRGGPVFHDFRIGDRVKVTMSGRTGEIISGPRRHSGWEVRWDEPVYGCIESWVAWPLMEPREDLKKCN
jgi:hypothetical protein